MARYLTEEELADQPARRGRAIDEPLLDEARSIGTFVGDKREMTDEHRLALLREQAVDGGITDGWQRRELDDEIRRLEQKTGRAPAARQEQAPREQPASYFADTKDPYYRYLQGLPAEDEKPAKKAEPKVEDSGITRRVLGDSAIDASKGVVDLGESVAGLASLASFGYAGKALQYIGYDPKASREMLDEMYTPQRKRANENVEAAKGFLETAGAIFENPSTAIGSLIESAPSMIGIGAAGGKLAMTAFVKGAQSVAGGVVTQGGKTLITPAGREAGAAAVKAAMNKILWTTSGAEGALAGGSIAEQARQAGREWNQYVLPSIGGGVATAVIGRAGGAVGQKLGLEDIETAIATRGLSDNSIRSASGTILSRVAGAAKGAAKGFAQEGVLEEMPQSASEQVFGNLAQGKPAGEGVAEAAAQGLVVGGAMGGGFGGLRGARAPAKPEQDDTAAAPPAAGQPAAEPQAEPAPEKLEPATPAELRELAQRDIDALAGAARGERKGKDEAGNEVVELLAPEEKQALFQLRRDIENPEELAKFYKRELVAGPAEESSKIDDQLFKFQTKEGKQRIADAGLDPIEIEPSGKGGIITDGDVDRALQSRRGQQIANLRGGRPAPVAGDGQALDVAPARTGFVPEEELSNDVSKVKVDFQTDKGVESHDAHRITRDDHKELKRLTDLVGANLKIIEHKDRDPKTWFDGAYDPKTNTIMLSRDSVSAHPLVVLGHEIGHSMKQNMPKEYAVFQKAVKQTLKKEVTAGGKKVSPLEAMKMQYTGDADMTDEMTNDLLGNRMKDVDFHRQVIASLDRSTAKKVYDFIINGLSKLIAKAQGKGFATDTYVQDMKAMRAAAVTAMRQMIEKNERTKAQQQKAEKKKVAAVAGDARAPPAAAETAPPAGPVAKAPAPAVVATPPAVGKIEEAKPAEKAKPKKVTSIKPAAAAAVAKAKTEKKPPLLKGTETKGLPAEKARWRMAGSLGHEGVVLGYVDTGRDGPDVVRFRDDDGVEHDVTPHELFPVIAEPKPAEETVAAEVKSPPPPAAPTPARQAKGTPPIDKMIEDYGAKAAWNRPDELRSILTGLEEDMDVNAIPEWLPNLQQVALQINQRIEQLDAEPISASPEPEAKAMREVAGMPEPSSVVEPTEEDIEASIPDKPGVLDPEEQAIEKMKAERDALDEQIINSIRLDPKTGKSKRVITEKQQAKLQERRDQLAEDIHLMTYRSPSENKSGKYETAVEQVVSKGKLVVEGVTDLTITEKDFTKLHDDFSEIIASPTDRVSMDTKLKGAPFITVKEANARIEGWKDHARKQGKSQKIDNSRRTVLSFFDLTGEWAQPWEDAGYNVITFDLQSGQNVLDFSSEYFTENWDISDVYCILAAVPCTRFSAAGNKHRAKHAAGGGSKDMKLARELVWQTMRTIEYFRPAVWAMENPVGTIQSETGLPDWRLAFNPHHFGPHPEFQQGYTKKTLLWGNFDPDLPTANVPGRKEDGGLGSVMHEKYGGSSMKTKNARSVTPEGFAYAFFMKNNYVDLSPERRLVADFPQIPNAVVGALQAGMTEKQIRDVATRPYEDYEVEEAADALLAAAKKTKKNAPAVAKASQKSKKELKKSVLRDEREKAIKYERANGIRPYVSEGQLEIDVDVPRVEREMYYSVKREGKHGLDARLGIPINENGTVTLYYPTTAESARRTSLEKKLRGDTPSAKRIYLTNESSGGKVHVQRGEIGDQQKMDGAAVMLQVDPDTVHTLAAYADGRKDFFIPIKEGASFEAKRTQLWNLNLPREAAISRDSTISSMQDGITKAVERYSSANPVARRQLVSQARKVLRDQHNIGILLGENGKLEKTRVGDYGLKYDGKSVASLGLGLASAQQLNEQRLSSCPQSAICKSLCLGETSGQNFLYGGVGQFRAGPRLAQYLRTEAVVLHPEETAIVLQAEIDSFVEWAASEDYAPAIRLNVTSDFPPKMWQALIKANPSVMFYDYTKLNSSTIAPNHHITYSSTGVSQLVDGTPIYNEHSNWPRMMQRLDQGANVAMAFTDRNEMPSWVVDEASGKRYQVWDGDNYDARFLDPKRKDGVGMIVGLSNKDRTTGTADAAQRTNGFFVYYDPTVHGDTVTIANQQQIQLQHDMRAARERKADAAQAAAMEAEGAGQAQGVEPMGPRPAAPSFEKTAEGPALIGNRLSIEDPVAFKQEGELITYEHKIEFDGEVVGRVSLVWKNDKVVFLPDISIFAHRQGEGIGEKTIKTILAHNGWRSEPLTIGHITESAEEFWRKMGASIYDTGEGQDGSLDLASYVQARLDRRGPDALGDRNGEGAATATEGSEGSDPAGAQGPDGRRPQGLERSTLRQPLFEQADDGPHLEGQEVALRKPESQGSSPEGQKYRHLLFHNGRRVGDITLGWKDGKVATLSDIWLNLEHRGQGIGPKVINDLMRHNGPEVSLIVEGIDPRRLNWWRRMGARVYPTQARIDGEITFSRNLGQGVADLQRPAGDGAAQDDSGAQPRVADRAAPAEGDRQDQGPSQGQDPSDLDFRSTLRNTDQRVGPRWYSELQRKITAGPNSAPRAAWLGYIEGLKQKGVKPEEIEWSGVKDWLAAGPDAAVVKKEEIQNFLGENGLRLEERTMTGQGGAEVSIDRDWQDDEPDENFFRQEAEDIHLDYSRQALERDLAEDDPKPTDEEVLEHAIDIAKKNYYSDPERAQMKKVEVEFKGQTYRFVATYQHGDMDIFAPANQGNELDKRGGESVLDVAGGSRSSRRPMDNPQIERAVKEYLAEVLDVDFDEEAAPYEQYTLSGGTNYTINLLKLPTKFTPEKTFVEPHHFDDKNIIAHVRTKDRTDADGKKVLFLEEIQSDWAQQGRDRGFAEPGDKDKIGLLRDKIRELDDAMDAADSLRKRRQGDVDYWRPPSPATDKLAEALKLRDEAMFEMNRLENERRTTNDQIDKLRKKNVPPGPFVKKTDSWVGLVLKRMLMRAVNEGYEAIAWTTGAQQADRYDLSHFIGQIMVRPAIGSAGVLGASSDIWVQASAKNTGRVIHSADVKREELAGIVGKEMALKIIKDIDADPATHVYNNLDLAVGGEGMTTFYEGIVPKVANDVLKKLGGGKVGTVPIGKAHREDIRISQHADGSATVEDGGKSIPFTTVAAAERYRDQLKGLKSQPGFYITEANKKSLDEGVPFMSTLRKAQEAVQTAPSVKFGFEPEWASESRRQPKTGKANSVVEQPLATFNKGTIEAREFTAYDNKGKLVGVLSVVTKGSGLGAFKITVRENAQRQGYGLKLLDAAEQAGIDMKASLAANRFTSEGRALAMSWLEKSDKDKELLRSALRLPRGDDVMYHVTFTKTIDKLKAEGIQPKKKANWFARDTFSAKPKLMKSEGVYAFESLIDAVRWASKMDWDLTEGQNNQGKVSVVAFKKSDGWKRDTRDPLTQSNARGRWLVRTEPVPASDIIAVQQYSMADAKQLVKLLDQDVKAAEARRAAFTVEDAQRLDAENKARRTIAADSLPEDMQQLLLDMWEMMSNKPMPQNLPVKTMPVSAFPQAELSAADDRGGIAHAEQMPDVSELPPVVVVGDDWVDGAHRIEAARMQGATEIQAIDLGELGVQYPKGKLPYNGTIKRSAMRRGALRPQGGTITGRLMHEPTLMGAPLDIRSRAYYMLREGRAESEVIELLNDVGVSDPQAAIDELKKSTWRNHVANAIANQTVPTTMMQAARDTLSDAIRPTEPGAFNVLHRTVGTQFHKSTISPHFKKVYDIANKFLDDVSMFAMRAEKMAPKIFPRIFGSGLNKTDNALIGMALAGGTLENGANPHNGVVWTDAQLQAKYNMTPEQIAIYREARAVIDQSLDDTAKTLMAQIARSALPKTAQSEKLIQSLVEQNLPLMLTRDNFIAALPQTKAGLDTAKEIRKIEGKTFSLKEHGYAPLMRFGKYTVEVKNAKGDTIFFSTHETKAERTRAQISAQGAFPNDVVSIGELNEEQHKLLGGVSPSTFEAFVNAIPLSSPQEEEARRKYLQHAVTNRSALMRMIERKGTAGYATDATRSLASFITSNARFGSKALNGAPLFKAVADIPKGTGNVQSEATLLRDYVLNPGESAAKFRGFLFFQFLGGSLAAGIVNLTQPALMTFPYLAQYGTRRASAAMTAGLADTAKWLGKKNINDPQLKAALEEAAKRGIIEPQEIFQLMAAARTGAASYLTHKLMRWWGSNFSVTEIFNRTYTFASAFRVGRDLGVADPYEFASTAVTESQGLYSKGNRPNWARETGSLGVAGPILFTFKQYSIAYVEFLKRLYGQGLLPKKSFLIALGMLALAAGAEGMPGAEDIDDLIETIAAWLGIPLNMKKEKRKLLRETIGLSPAATEFVLHGISAGLPFDVHARLGVHNIIPGTALFNPTKNGPADKASEALEVLGPAGSVGQSAMDFGKKAVQGDFGGAAKAVLPKALRDLVQGTEMLFTGKMKDQRDRMVMESTPAEAVSKMAGFNPERAARETRIIQSERVDQSIVSSKKSELHQRIAKAIAEGDEASRQKALDEYRSWNQKNPDYRFVLNPVTITTLAQDMRRSRANRFIKGSPKDSRREVREALSDE